MKRSPFDSATLNEIFKFDPEDQLRLSSRESGKLEFKEAFHFGSAGDYAKTMAAFANSAGGYLVFGVKDKPRILIGLKNESFDSLDPAKLTQTLNSLLAPEIRWEAILHRLQGKTVGIIYIHEAQRKPVLCVKTTKEVQEGSIYYRYHGRSEKIRFPELRQLLESEREKERRLWTQTLRRIARIGIENVGVLNSITGEISGNEGSFLISEELLPQIQFIHSGSFIQSGGQPTLKLIGEVHAIHPQLVRRPLHGPDILGAFVRRESVLTPLDYVKQVCFEPSQFYPIYFFIGQTRVKIADVITELEKVDCRASGKNKLIGRLKANEKLVYGSLRSSSDAGKVLTQTLSALIDKSLTDEGCRRNLRVFFYALTHLTKENSDPDFLLPLIQRVALPQYSSLKSFDATYMRKAMCHLDLIWYRQGVAKNSEATAQTSK